MAKPPGERTKLIRQAIADHPGLGNTELAKLLNDQKPGHDIKPVAPGCWPWAWWSPSGLRTV